MLLTTSCKSNTNNSNSTGTSVNLNSHTDIAKNDAQEEKKTDENKNSSETGNNAFTEITETKKADVSGNKSFGTVKTESGKTQISKKSESKDIKEPDSKRTSETLSFEQESDGQIMIPLLLKTQNI